MADALQELARGFEHSDTLVLIIRHCVVPVGQGGDARGALQLPRAAAPRAQSGGFHSDNKDYSRHVQYNSSQI